MTPIKGSTIADTKAALITALKARPGLADVNISYAGPRFAKDVKNDAGDFEAIWLDDAPQLGPATGQNVVTIIKGLPLEIDDNYDFTVVIQVLRPTSDATLEETEARSVELLGEVLGLLSADPNVGLSPASYLLNECLPYHWDHRTGHLPSPPGFGSRFHLHLRVQARLALS